MTISIVGTMKMRISVSFHCATNAMINAVTKVDSAWMTIPSFSPMPDCINLPLVVACCDIEPETSLS